MREDFNQSNTQPQKLINNHTGSLAIILALLVVLIILIIGIFYNFNISQKNYKPTTIVTVNHSISPIMKIPEDWKTYIDPKGLFTFHYPPSPNITVEKYFNEKSNPKPDWVITDVDFRLNSQESEGQDSVGPFYFALLVSDNTNHLTLEKIKADVSKRFFAQSLKIYKSGEIDGLEYQNEEGKGSSGQIYSTPTITYLTNSRVYTFTYNSLNGLDYGRGVDEKTREYMDKILSTFKFTNQNQINTLVGWKTYKHTDFMFQYPQEATIDAGPGTSSITKKPDFEITIKPPYEPPWEHIFYLYVSVEDNPLSLTNQEWVDLQIKTFDPNSIGTIDKIRNSLKEYQNGEINGLIMNDGHDYDYLLLFLTRNDKFYTFRMTGDQGGLNDYVIEIFDKILATFKFTK